jgi:hypothetical protein
MIEYGLEALTRWNTHTAVLALYLHICSPKPAGLNPKRSGAVAVARSHDPLGSQERYASAFP